MNKFIIYAGDGTKLQGFRAKLFISMYGKKIYKDKVLEIKNVKFKKKEVYNQHNEDVKGVNAFIKHCKDNRLTVEIQFNES